MAISDALLREFDQETANTRRTLERLPEDKLTWKPHERSGTMGWLGGHLANLPTWAVIALEKDSIDIGGDSPQLPAPTSRNQILDTFDANVKAARAAIAAAKDEKWLEPWSLLRSGKTVLTLPRAVVMRSFVMNHSIHHRAQLTVYLRLNNVPVPALYGPSADEGGFI